MVKLRAGLGFESWVSIVSVDEIAGVYWDGQTIYETAISNGCLVNVCGCVAINIVDVRKEEKRRRRPGRCGEVRPL